jgi:RNA polymerase sigma-70 factor (ECF subfamily)
MTTEVIYNTFRAEMRKFIFSKIKDKATTDDLMQEVYLKIHANIAHLRDLDRVRPWVFAITRNMVNDHFRNQKFDKELDSLKLSSMDAATPVNDQFNACMMPLVDKLPATLRTAIILTDLKGMSQTSLAKKLKISYSGAKSRVQRARELLKKNITDCCNIVSDKYGNIVSHEPRGNCSCLINHQA